MHYRASKVFKETQIFLSFDNRLMHIIQVDIIHHIKSKQTLAALIPTRLCFVLSNWNVFTGYFLNLMRMINNILFQLLNSISNIRNNFAYLKSWY